MTGFESLMACWGTEWTEENGAQQKRLLVDFAFSFVDCMTCPKKEYCTVKLNQEPNFAVKDPDKLRFMDDCKSELYSYLSEERACLEPLVEKNTAIAVNSWSEYCRFCNDNNKQLAINNRERINLHSLLTFAKSRPLAALVVPHQDYPLVASVEWFNSVPIRTMSFEDLVALNSDS